MSITRISEGKKFPRSLSLTSIAVFFCIIALSHPALGQTNIDIGDWFLLTPDSHWNYTGEGQPNSSAEDDFTNTVLDEKVDVGNDIMATRIKMTTETDERNGDQMFWYLNPDGQFFFCGFHNETADDIGGGSFIAQDVILDEPLLMGEKGQKIGGDVTKTGTTLIKAKVPFLGQQDMPTTLTSTVTYQELIPHVETSFGFFVNVLRLVINISMEIQLPLGAGSQTSDLFSGEFWLKKGVGMIYQKQYGKESDKDKGQIIKEGNISGSDIQADVDEINETLPNAIKILQTLCGETQGAGKELDISGDDRVGLAEEIYLLEKFSGLKVFTIESSAFSAGASIPEQHTADGDDISPAFSWKNAPLGTRSFVLIMDDPDAVPVGGAVWDHWILFDIPASTTALDEDAGAEGDGNLPAGAKHGTNSWKSAYYQGPDPPPGADHRYFFKLYALNTAELTSSGNTKADMEAAMKGHILGEIEFMGTYTR